MGLSLNEPFLYYGNLNCPDFLSRLYNLHKLPSFDSRVENAYDDIYRVTFPYLATLKSKVEYSCLAHPDFDDCGIKLPLPTGSEVFL